MEKFITGMVTYVASSALLAWVLMLCFNVMHDGYPGIPAFGYVELLGASIAFTALANVARTGPEG